MKSAASSTSHVRAPKPQKFQPNSRRNRLNALTHGLAALLIGLVIVTTAMVGAALALAVSMQARSDIRATAAYASPSGRLAWPGQDAGEMAGRWSSATEQAAEIKFDLPGTFALFDPKPSAGTKSASAADPATTGSVGAPGSYKLASLDVGVIGSSANPATLAEAEPPPLPRPRPRLASLTPMQGVGINSGEETRPVRTAIYDITAKIVYLPNGEKLEAHSGFGGMMDDPRYVHVRMRGATPPNVYDLRLRESLFHGVQAIRLTPVNERDMFGRDGILAHTYMLGPNGQSNGCVSFRDYAKFLRAFQHGEITRMIVVPHLATAPVVAAAGRSGRSANNTF